MDTNSVLTSSLEISVVLGVGFYGLEKAETQTRDMVDSSSSTVPDSLCDFQLIFKLSVPQLPHLQNGNPLVLLRVE